MWNWFLSQQVYKLIQRQEATADAKVSYEKELSYFKSVDIYNYVDNMQ